MLRDLRYGWRQLQKQRAFTLAAVISLALGIGATVTMFSAFRAVLLRPLPYRDGNRLVELQRHSIPGDTSGVTFADVEFLRKYAHSFEAIAWYSGLEITTLSRVSNPANLWMRSVSPGLFPLLESKPLLGRTLAPGDFKAAAPRTVVLSYEAWQKYFHGDPALIGKQIFLSQQYPVSSASNVTVAGVMPKQFFFPQIGILGWLPDRRVVTDPLHTGANAIGRLRAGFSVAQLHDELRRLTPAMQQNYPPSDRGWTLSAVNFAAHSVEGSRNALIMLMAAAAFLVLLSCLNVANLLLARASARSSEFAIRGALGATRKRLLRQVLIESLTLSTLGGACGLALAYAGNRALVWLLPEYLKIPRLGETRLDLAVLLFAAAIACGAGLLFGLAPAFALAGRRLTSADRQARSSRACSWSGSLLLISEIAVSLILLTGATLMMRGFVKLANVDPGFRTAHILTAGVPPSHASALSRDKIAIRYSQLLDVSRNVPGVESAALTSALPLGRITVGLTIYPPGATEARAIDFHAVSRSYFRIMGIPLLRGRLFDPLDPKADKGAIIINREMADEYWPNQDPIGKHLSSAAPPAKPDLTVIGVAGNVRHQTLSGSPVPEFYESYQQYFGPAIAATLVVRTYGDPGSVAASLRRAIHKFDPAQVVENEQAIAATVAETIAAPKFYTILLAIFALLALAIALIGVYGVTSYSTSLRTREFGIRMSLGADRKRLTAMLLRQGLWKALVGIAIGCAGAWVLARFMAGFVYGIPVRDPISLTIAGAALIAGSLIALYLPARRSTEVDPARVLRD